VGGHRQQRGVPPDALRPSGDQLAEFLTGGGELVRDLQRAEAFGARSVRAEFDPVPALATGQRDSRTEVDMTEFRGGGEQRR